MSAQPQADNDDYSGGAGEVRVPAVIGVLGAGTMGAGIAQLAARAGARTLLHDPVAEALAGGVAKIEDGLGKEAAKGRISDDEARAAVARLQPAAELAQLAPCELVIEAAPEALGAQARALPPAVGDRRRAMRAGEQHLVAAGDGDRAGGKPPRARRGHALLQPCAGDAPAGGGRRRAVQRRGAGDRRRHRQGDGQDGDPRQRRSRLSDQSQQPSVRAGVAANACGGDRRRGDDRPHLPHGGRLSHGSVRADGPGRRGRRL